MCILAVFRHKRPTLEMLKKFENANGDGGGVGYFGPQNKAYFKKNLNAQETFKITEALPLPFVVHFRLASCGGKSPLLTHPFVMSKESPLSLEGSSERLLAHNGHVSEHELLLSAANIDFPNDNLPVSDTRAIAAIASQNERFLGKVKGNYAVIDGKTKKIRLYGSFQEEDGALFSNMTWKWKGSTYSSTYCSTSRSSTSFENEGGKINTPVNDEVKTRKQKRKEWWENYLKVRNIKITSDSIPSEGNENGTFGNETPPVRIHEQPPQTHFVATTKEIIGHA